MAVTNRFKGLDLIDRVPEELWTEVHDIVQEAVIKTIPKKKKCKKGKEEAREFQKNIYFCLIDCVKASACVDHNKLWKILKETGIPDHLTCILRNLYAGQETTVRTGHRTTDWFQIRKGVRQGCIWSPCLFIFYAGSIMQNGRLEEAQAGIKVPGEISITSDMQ